MLIAALQIIDEGGAAALTMRRLGQALDRNPMGIYAHAADKDALLDLVVEHVVSDLVVSREPSRDEGGEGDWVAALHRARVPPDRPGSPNVVPLLVTRLPSGPMALRPLGTLRPLEELLEVFIGAGFDPTARCTPPGCSPGSAAGSAAGPAPAGATIGGSGHAPQ